MVSDILMFIISEFPAYTIDGILDLPFPQIIEMAKMAAFAKRLKFEPFRAILTGLSSSVGGKKSNAIPLNPGGAIPPGFGKVKKHGRK